MQARAPVRFGLALVENAYEETVLFEAVLPAAFETREEYLLTLATRWLAAFAFSRGRPAIVDEIGKDISGAGMDTNVVGRKRAFRYQPTAGQPNMCHIFVRGLNERTHGNATGIGFADFTTARLIRAMNYRDTIVNCLTAGHPDGARLPVYFETDREVLEAALAIIGVRSPLQARIQRIRNTLRLEEVEVSEPCLAERTIRRIRDNRGSPFAHAGSSGQLAAILIALDKSATAGYKPPKPYSVVPKP